MRRKLKQIFDKKFFILVTVVFLGTFGAGLVFSSEEIRISNSSGFKELITGEVEKENFDQVDSGSDEQKTDNTSPEILGKETAKEVTTKEILVQETEYLSTDLVNLKEEAKTAVSQLIDVLVKSDSPSLYNLLGEDLKGTFGEEEFSQALATGLNIEKIKILSGPEISGEWSEVVIELSLNDVSKQQYIAVFHLENGEWKLFGTEEL